MTDMHCYHMHYERINCSTLPVLRIRCSLGLAGTGQLDESTNWKGQRGLDLTSRSCRRRTTQTPIC
ncbi:hypothetical protein PAXRUDRAFT_366038 [Paxillus rubicundulus Ve08.2h10]|uniref:Unplaced genomic scaffold scaffold_2040, whole genome shotgun sequence n=1 Tax=Paxillus rubicundulus Ve08.2h10 TaxID=930991 RepID=A0A0D0D2E9_9AGAM|nr:hypothetical protein PAXRUDRAFT_366038 [Paxillus rubicundulus Ve08.2h10]